MLNHPVFNEHYSLVVAMAAYRIARRDLANVNRFAARDPELAKRLGSKRHAMAQLNKDRARLSKRIAATHAALRRRGATRT